MRIVILALILALSGCAGNKIASGGLQVSPASGKELVQQHKVELDESLLKECGALSHIKENPSSDEVLQAKGADALIYKECADSKSKLIDWARKILQLN